MWAVSLCAPHYRPHSDRVVWNWKQACGQGTNLPLPLRAISSILACERSTAKLTTQPQVIHPNTFLLSTHEIYIHVEHMQHLYSIDLFTEKCSFCTSGNREPGCFHLVRVFFMMANHVRQGKPTTDQVLRTLLAFYNCTLDRYNYNVVTAVQLYKVHSWNFEQV